MKTIFDHLLRPELAPLKAYTVPAETFPIKLDANESPWSLPDEARRRIAAELAKIDLHRYPDPAATELRSALGDHLDAHPDQLVIGSGSDEVISILLTALSRPRPGRAKAAVLYPTPTFVMFRISALAHGLEPVEVPLDAQWQIDLPATLETIRQTRPNVIFLATPNNPTGNAFYDTAIEQIIRTASDSLVVIDEAYRAFAGRTLTRFFGAHANVALLGTLSKVGLAAARVGWARLPRALAKEIEKARQPYNLNALSQRVACLALRELAPVLEEHVAKICDERERLGALLEHIPRLEVFPSVANFFFVRFAGDADVLAGNLRAQGILVRSFHSLGGALAGCLRITVGTPQENDRLVGVLRETLG